MIVTPFTEAAKIHGQIRRLGGYDIDIAEKDKISTVVLGYFNLGSVRGVKLSGTGSTLTLALADLKAEARYYQEHPHALQNRYQSTRPSPSRRRIG